MKYDGGQTSNSLCNSVCKCRVNHQQQYACRSFYILKTALEIKKEKGMKTVWLLLQLNIFYARCIHFLPN